MMLPKELLSYRKKINQLDRMLIETIAKRLKIVQALSPLKKKKHLPIVDVEREKELKILHHQFAKTLNIDPLFIEKIFRHIIAASRKIQKTHKKVR